MQHLGFDFSKAVVCTATPRILSVCITAGKKLFAFVVAHALTSAAPEDEIRLWWAQLDSALRRLPRQAMPALMLDANARVTVAQIEHRLAQADPIGENANQMLALAGSHALDAGPLFDAHGKRHVTWTAPNGSTSQIDYVPFPEDMQAAVVSARVPAAFVDPHGFDHTPLEVAFQWREESHPVKRTAGIDAEQLRTNEGRRQLAAIYAAAPLVPWDVHPDTHLQIINDHLFFHLSRCFPKQAAKPRGDGVSDVQWAAIRERRHARRLMHRAKCMARRVLLWKYFGGWQRRPNVVQSATRQLREKSMCEARLVLVVRSLNMTVRKRSRIDAASFARQAMHEARNKGPHELHRLLRGTLKMGRRYKAPQVLPALSIGDQVLTDATAIHQAFEAHFAIPENACQASELIATAGAHVTHASTIDACHLPTVTEVTSGFLELQCRRAPGASLLPAEAYQCAAAAAAMVHYPIFMKSVARDTCPLLWQGTKSVAIPKLGKPAYTLQGWRHIALLEASAKGFGKAIRKRLAACLLNCAGLGQHGALPGQSLGAPSHSVIAYNQVAKRRRQSGAIVFLDGKAAYYSVIREFLVPSGEEHECERLRTFLKKMHHDEEQQDALLAALAGPGILANAGVPPGLVDFLRSSLHNSWFAICPYDGNLQATGTGTVPGTPLADILFQFAQSTFMHHLSAQLEASGLHTKLHSCGAPASHPAWADDVAIFAPLSRADEVQANLCHIIRAADACSRRTGIELNFDVGKTECVCLFNGKGSKEVRRTVLSAEQPTFTVSLESGRDVAVRIVPQYTHLGSILHFSGSCLQDVQEKSRHADAIFARLSRTLLRNPELSLPEKRQLVLGLVHSKLSFGAGLWMPRTQTEHAIIHTDFMKHWRSACRLLTGVSSKFLDDDALCALLGVLPPAEVLRIARVRQLRVHCLHPDPFLREVVQAAFDWLEQALHDLGHMWQVCYPEEPLPSLTPLNCWAPLASLASKFPALLRAFKQHWLRLLALDSDFHLRQCQTLWRFEKAGGIQLKLGQLASSLPHCCDSCGARFARRAGLAVHQLKMHGVRSVLSVAAGVECQVCRTLWWTTSRFRAHLEKTELCRVVYANADLDVASPTENVGHRRDRAWQPPARVAGPCPFWATLRRTDLPPAPALAEVDAMQLLANLLSHTCQDNFEAWSKLALRWILKSGHDPQGPDELVHSSRHPWKEVVLLLLRLQKDSFTADLIQCGALLGSADGHNIWLCYE